VGSAANGRYAALLCACCVSVMHMLCVQQGVVWKAHCLLGGGFSLLTRAALQCARQRQLIAPAVAGLRTGASTSHSWVIALYTLLVCVGA
jgi:hypothetical protein